MSITSGDPNHYFAVYPATQNLRTSQTVTPVPTAVYNIGVTATNAGGTSAPAAMQVAVGTQSPGFFNDQTNNNFSIAWDAVPTQNLEDVFSGISLGLPSDVISYACIVRFNTAGNIDARNAGAYAATATVPYTAGTTYHIRLAVRIASHTYDVFVTPQGQSEILLASNFAFRTEQASVATLDYLSKFITSGDATLSNMVSPPPLGVAPVVSNRSMILTTAGANFVAGEIVGSMTSLYEPTSWAITGVSGANVGDFAITPNLTGDFTGDISVTANGVSHLGGQAGTATLTITATNSFGTSASATATVNYSASATHIPTSFNDPIFAGMTELTSGSIGVPPNQSFKSVIETNGNPATFICNTGATIDHCRVQSYECIRMNSGNVNISNSYFEVVQPPVGFHSDGCQCFAPGTRGAVLTFDTVMFQAVQSFVTAELFAANNWGGTIHVNNCIFGRSTIGIKIAADGGAHIDVYMNGVYFVGPFSTGPWDFVNNVTAGGAGVTIQQWDNVFNATIVNGVLVPGSQIVNPPTVRTQ